MSCCGQKRAELVQGAAEPAAPGASVKSAFTQKSPVLIRGPVTGRHYQFHNGVFNREVDSRDAAVLLKSGYFK